MGCMRATTPLEIELKLHINDGSNPIESGLIQSVGSFIYLNTNQPDIAFIVIMVIGGLLCLTLLRPHKLTRDDGSVVAVDRPRGVWEELRTNLLVFTDPILLMMLPAFLPAEGFLVYSGSVNGRRSKSVTRSALISLQLSTTISAHAHCFLSSLLSYRYQQGGRCNTSSITRDGVAASADWSA